MLCVGFVGIGVGSFHFMGVVCVNVAAEVCLGSGRCCKRWCVMAWLGSHLSASSSFFSHFASHVRAGCLRIAKAGEEPNQIVLNSLRLGL